MTAVESTVAACRVWTWSRRSSVFSSTRATPQVESAVRTMPKTPDGDHSAGCPGTVAGSSGSSVTTPGTGDDALRQSRAHGRACPFIRQVRWHIAQLGLARADVEDVDEAGELEQAFGRDADVRQRKDVPCSSASLRRRTSAPRPLESMNVTSPRSTSTVVTAAERHLSDLDELRRPPRDRDPRPPGRCTVLSRTSSEN